MKRFGSYTNNKYGAHKVTFKGIEFDSKYEMERYIYLLGLQREGKIAGLRRQVGFTIIPKIIKNVPKQLKTKVRWETKVVEKEARYHCDFLYEEDGKIIVEEFKSVHTKDLPDYVLRRKLMVAKIYEHDSMLSFRPNSKEWVFREIVYGNKKITITDK